MHEYNKGMQIHLVSLFPEMFRGSFSESIIKRAQEKGLVQITVHNLRDWAVDNYKTVDDRPYGGGAGMLLRVDVIERAVSYSKLQIPNSKVILMDAGGIQYTQTKAREFSHEENLIIICGHYEGVDHRVHEQLVDEVISVGPYVLSGGEIPAMTVVDSIVRLVPGTLGNAESLTEESHNTQQVEYPQYTRPETYKGWEVPKVLLGGNHKAIAQWRSENAPIFCDAPLPELA